MENIEFLIDQMTNAVISRNELVMRECEQTIWREKLSLDSIKEPSRSDPLFYVVQACLIKEMAVIWSLPPKNTFLNVPKWALEAPALLDSFSVIGPEDMVFWEHEESNPIFKQHNIYAPCNYLFFL